MKRKADLDYCPISLDDLYVGAWIRAYSDFTKRYSPPARVTAIFDDGLVYYMFDEEQGDPFEDRIENIHAIPVFPDILRGFGFELSEPKKDLYGREIILVSFGGTFFGVLHNDNLLPYVIPYCINFSKSLCRHTVDLFRHLRCDRIDTSKITWHGV